MFSLIHSSASGRARMPMQRNRALKTVAAIVVSFIGLVGAIMLLFATKIITFELAMLMFVALLAMYTGFGILIAAYRLIGRLQ